MRRPASGAGPVASRLRYLKAPRDIAVVKAAAEHAGWQPRPSLRPDRTGDTLTGRGIAYAQRSGAVVTIVAEVDIDRRTAKICARKLAIAHNCGLIINPDGLRRCIEGNVVPRHQPRPVRGGRLRRPQGDQKIWLSYPIRDITEAPETIDIALINRPELPPACLRRLWRNKGAGRAVARPVLRSPDRASGAVLRCADDRKIVGSAWAAHVSSGYRLGASRLDQLYEPSHP
jgi:hypothetical protein